MDMDALESRAHSDPVSAKKVAKEPEPALSLFGKKPEPASAKKPEPASAKKPEPASAKKPEPASAKKPEPAPAKKPEPASAKKSEPASAKKPEPASAKKPEPASAKKPEPASAIKAPIQAPATVKVSEFSNHIVLIVACHLMNHLSCLLLSIDSHTPYT
jgi:FtsZ-interacting cell division protein ZipA